MSQPSTEIIAGMAIGGPRAGHVLTGIPPSLVVTMTESTMRPGGSTTVGPAITTYAVTYTIRRFRLLDGEHIHFWVESTMTDADALRALIEGYAANEIVKREGQQKGYPVTRGPNPL